jgi:endonuclease/exonuclease/phosphatase family metal-dependent hydrolase
MGKHVSHKVSILSYNLYCLPWLACIMKPSTCPHSYERVKTFLKHIPQYDIIGLQEVWSPRYQQVESFAKREGLHVVGSSQASVTNMLGLRVFGGGLMILSKYPIETTRELVFDKGVASDGFVTKGVLYAKVKIGSSYVHVFNTHMQASYGYEFKENDPYALIRQKQIKEVSSFIAKIALDDDHPIIAMGDFNVNAIRRPDEPSSDSREYAEMISMLSSNGLFSVVDIHKEFHGGHHPITNSGRGVKAAKDSKGGQRLDFVFEIRRNRTRQDRIFHAFPHCAVEHFEVADEVYTHISDHYASHVTMEVYARTVSNAEGAEGGAMTTTTTRRTAMTVQLEM